MPKYNQNTLTNSPVPALGPGVPGGVLVWNAETKAFVTATPTSQQFNIPKMPWARGIIRISVELSFSGDPGAFTVQIQGADTDADANYVAEPFAGQNPGTLTEANLNANFVCRAEFDITANFGRLKMAVAPTNNVTVTAGVHML